MSVGNPLKCEFSLGVYDVLDRVWGDYLLTSPGGHGQLKTSGYFGEIGVGTQQGPQSIKVVGDKGPQKAMPCGNRSRCLGGTL